MMCVCVRSKYINAILKTHSFGVVYWDLRHLLKRLRSKILHAVCNLHMVGALSLATGTFCG